VTASRTAAFPVVIIVLSAVMPAGITVIAPVTMARAASGAEGLIVAVAMSRVAPGAGSLIIMSRAAPGVGILVITAAVPT
jgi:hypothetical protein